MPDEPDKYIEGYREGHKAGHGVGYTDGKGAGYSDAKVRAHLALEAACDQIGLPGSQREVLMRALDNVLGKVN